MGLEDLARYESAVVASHNLKERPALALTAITEFYGSRKDLQEDPFVNKYLKRAVEDAQVGLQNGLGISSADIINSANVYGDKYEETFIKSKISDLVAYLNVGYNIPELAKEAILKYGDSTYEDLVKKMKDKETPKEELESIQKTVRTIEILKERRIEAAGLNVLNRYTTANLEGMYPKPKEEKK